MKLPLHEFSFVKATAPFLKKQGTDDYLLTFIFGISTYPIVPYRNLPQILSGMTAHCCSLISEANPLLLK